MGWVVYHDFYALCLFRRCAQLEGLMNFMDRARGDSTLGDHHFGRMRDFLVNRRC
jgi:hypothetical protein